MWVPIVVKHIHKLLFSLLSNSLSLWHRFLCILLLMLLQLLPVSCHLAVLVLCSQLDAVRAGSEPKNNRCGCIIESIWTVSSCIEALWYACHHLSMPLTLKFHWLQYLVTVVHWWQLSYVVCELGLFVCVYCINSVCIITLCLCFVCSLQLFHQ